MFEPSSEPVVVAILPHAAELAEKIAAKIGGRVDLRGSDFTDTGAHLRSLFLAGHPIVGIGAAGIYIRSLASVLGDKNSEPPVLAVSEDARNIVPLLGGHHGANGLAKEIADYLETAAAVTTSGDVALGVALDEPPQGWKLENPEDAKGAMAALLGGAKAQQSGNADWLTPLSSRVEFSETDADAPVVLSVEGAAPLIYRRQSFALGLGCARGCDPDELIALVAKTLADNGRSIHEVAMVGSIDIKSDEAAIHAVARHLGVPARFFDADELNSVTPRLANPSEVVRAEVGVAGVSEGAALVMAGVSGALVIEKTKTANATCALARISQDGSEGRARGSLAVVGIGPGQAEWRTPEASRLVADADELVGYGLYLELLGPEAKGKAQKTFALGEEEARCRYALERAGEGVNVALVCSGDGGIYAMGALVMELLDRDADQGGVSAAAKRVAVVHAPGVSALQAASARMGAILGHDFCTISLSDLLTPREAIIKRLHSAAEGDFVTAFYNPVSRKRRTLLAMAREIYLEHRPSDTPVLLASNLGRPDEKLVVRDLKDLDVDEVDMLTIVLIGASTSRRIKSGDISTGAQGTWIYTPRGYAKRIDGEKA